MSELLFKSAKELSDLMQSGALTSAELVDSHLRQIEEFNPKLRALVTVDAEGARELAREADEARNQGEIWGPLHGLPVTIKDSFLTKGLRTSFVTPFFKNHIPAEDATQVSLMRNSGAIIIGKSNMPVAAYDWQSENPMFGRTLNPYRGECSPGGSSGGSSAALAAGFAALELGSDVAGSIRVPCHFCGVAGIRPTEGRLSNVGGDCAPGGTRTLRNLLTSAPMARRVSDLEWIFPIFDQGDRADWRVHGSRPEKGLPRSLKGLKVKFTMELGGVPVCSETRKAMQICRAVLRDQGCSVEEVPEPFCHRRALNCWGRIQAFETLAQLPFPLRGARWLFALGLTQYLFGRGHFSRGLAQGAAMGPRAYFQALQERDGLVAELNDFLTEIDIWITPVSSTPAFTQRPKGKPIEVDDALVNYGDAQGMYNCGSALTAEPIVVFGVHQLDDERPVGLQFHAARWRDRRLLRICALLEKQLPQLPPPDLSRL